MNKLIKSNSQFIIVISFFQVTHLAISSIHSDKLIYLDVVSWKGFSD